MLLKLPVRMTNLRLLAILSMLATANCRTAAETSALHDAGDVATAPAANPGMVRVIPDLYGRQLCLSRSFATNTFTKFDPDSTDQTQTQINTEFTVDESQRQVNAYWMMAAAWLSYVSDASAEQELRNNWGATDFQSWSVQENHPALDAHAFFATFTHNPSLDQPAKTIQTDVGTIDVPAQTSVGDMAILAFRGTDPKVIANIETDLRDMPIEMRSSDGTMLGYAHQGFLQTLDAMWPDILAKAKAANRPIWVTGHSLGAAVATLAAARLITEGVPIAALYTFGSPRVGLMAKPGNVNLIDTINQLLLTNNVKLRRYVNHNDAVVRIPDRVTGALGGLSNIFYEGLTQAVSGGWQQIGLANSENDVLLWYGNQRTPYSNADAMGRMAKSLWGLSLGPAWVEDHLPPHYLQKIEIDVFGKRTRCPGDVDPEVPN